MKSSMLPTNTPQRSQADVLKFLTKKKPEVDLTRPILFAVRGYYLNSMGVKAKNDRRIYDDAAWWISPTLFAAFNFNTDPNGYRAGSGTGSRKGMAVLKPGVWDYQIGIHRGYQAFVQAGPVTVIRDGNPPYPDTGWFGINIHHGGSASTSSIGCQTVPWAEQWSQFKSLGYSELARYKASRKFQYVLVDQSETGWNQAA